MQFSTLFLCCFGDWKIGDLSKKYTSKEWPLAAERNDLVPVCKLVLYSCILNHPEYPDMNLSVPLETFRTFHLTYLVHLWAVFSSWPSVSPFPFQFYILTHEVYRKHKTLFKTSHSFSAHLNRRNCRSSDAAMQRTLSSPIVCMKEWLMDKKIQLIPSAIISSFLQGKESALYLPPCQWR